MRFARRKTTPAAATLGPLSPRSSPACGGEAAGKSVNFGRLPSSTLGEGELRGLSRTILPRFGDNSQSRGRGPADGIIEGRDADSEFMADRAENAFLRINSKIYK